MRLRGLIRKESLQILRDPSSIAIAFVMPVVLLLLFGFGVSLDAKNIRLALVVEQADANTASLAAAFRSSEFFLPSFCDVRLVFAVVVITELLAFVLALAGPGMRENPWENLGLISLFMQWIALTSAAVLCGARGYKAISEWAEDLGQKARARFRCRYRNGRYKVPSRTLIRDVLTRVDPTLLDRALQAWNAQYAATDEGLAIDGKTMCNAIDDEGRQTHILSVVGHQTQACYTQKKSPPCR